MVCLTAAATSQGVGAGLEIDADRDGCRAVVGRQKRVMKRAQFHPRHVLEAERAAVLLRAQDDVLELARIGELARRRHRKREGLGFRHRLLAEAAGRELCVLLADRRRDVAGCQIVLCDLVGPEPDSHRIVRRAEQRGIAHPRRPPQLVDHVDEGVVRDEDRVVARVRRRHRQDLQDRARLLAAR